MGLVSVEEAVERVLGLVSPLSAERVRPTARPVRVVAEDVRARRTLPPWDNSAMDGYAVRAADLTKGATLRVTSTIHAGDRPTTPVEAGCCARIMTGAPMPAGADSVVMQERVRVLADGQVAIDEAPKHGQHVRKRGEDVTEGAVVFSAGTPLSVGALGALWAQGLSEVAVHRRPTVAIASSGDELCDVEEEPNGRIVDTNTPVLAQLAELAGAQPTILGRAKDRLEELTALFGRGLGFDVLLTVAGASVGERDFTRDAFEALGVSIDFWKVAMKPGKPLAVGRKGHTLVIGLPGNPISAMVTFSLFVAPALRKLQGLVPTPPLVPARLAEPVRKSAGLRHFVRGRVERRGSELWAIPLSNQSSGALSGAVGATHLISLSPNATEVGSGEFVDLVPVDWGA